MGNSSIQFRNSIHIILEFFVTRFTKHVSILHGIKPVVVPGFTHYVMVLTAPCISVCAQTLTNAAVTGTDASQKTRLASTRSVPIAALPFLILPSLHTYPALPQPILPRMNLSPVRVSWIAIRVNRLPVKAASISSFQYLQPFWACSSFLFSSLLLSLSRNIAMERSSRLGPAARQAQMMPRKVKRELLQMRSRIEWMNLTFSHWISSTVTHAISASWYPSICSIFICTKFEGVHRVQARNALDFLMCSPVLIASLLFIHLPVRNFKLQVARSYNYISMVYLQFFCSKVKQCSALQRMKLCSPPLHRTRFFFIRNLFYCLANCIQVSCTPRPVSLSKGSCVQKSSYLAAFGLLVDLWRARVQERPVWTSCMGDCHVCTGLITIKLLN